MSIFMETKAKKQKCCMRRNVACRNVACARDDVIDEAKERIETNLGVFLYSKKLQERRGGMIEKKRIIRIKAWMLF